MGRTLRLYLCKFVWIYSNKSPGHGFCTLDAEMLVARQKETRAQSASALATCEGIDRRHMKAAQQMAVSCRRASCALERSARALIQTVRCALGGGDEGTHPF
ncbi:hypothetical protein G5I_04812 [Acromyrmex echinatior]|uniref:Uncharacterized protein n=1 Tax=Acromyrmex echinatior TaxID=103372 RepID=F4WGM8_ACREC|nr:hypothetical protein G5I_04812 [Acromyrmex echinatior]